MQIKTAEGSYTNVAGGGTTALGIVGTVLGGIAVAGLANNGNGGLLGLSGNNSNQTSALQSQIARLESEKYTDQKSMEDRDRIAALNEKFIGYVIDIDKRVSSIETAAPLREQIVMNKIECCCNSANAAITALANTVANITKTVVPNSSVCPGWGTVTVTPSGSSKA